MVEPPQALLQFIRKYRSLAVIGHKEPDGDCVGSQLGLAGALARNGWSVIPVNVGPFRRPEIATYEEQFSSTLGDSSGVEAVIIVDCSSEDRIGRVADQIKDLPKAIIDHHAAGTTFGDLRYIDPKARATTLLIHRLLAALEITPSPEEAGHLFLGLVTDTGFFRFLDSSDAEALSDAAALVELGASPKAVYRQISGTRSFDSRRLLARMLHRSERIANGRVIITYQTKADVDEFGPNARDSDTLYRLLLSVRDVEAIAVAKYDTEQDGCTVSLRSNTYYDVSRVASEFCGGGHKNAAGFFVEDTLQTLLPKLRKRLIKDFNSSNNTL